MLKYQQIAKEIENYIYSNSLPQGTKLPTVENFAFDYKVSKSTIGSGIFVRRRNRTGYIDFNILAGFTSSLKEFKITSKVLDFDIIKADNKIAQLLECNLNDEIYKIKRIRYINNEIMCYEESYYKKSVVPYLTKEIAKESIFEYLNSALNLNMGFSDRYFNVIKLDKHIANLLELNPNDPAMSVLEQIYLSSGIMFNFSKIIYHYKHTQFYSQSTSIK